jgi:hypothetical protein
VAGRPERLQALLDDGGDARMTSGEISSRLAMRVSTSTRRSSGSEFAAAAPPGGLEVREDERDRLRVLALDELGQLLRVGLLERVEGPAVDSNDLTTRSRTRRAISGPSDFAAACCAYSTPPAAVEPRGDRECVELLEHPSPCSELTDPMAATSRVIFSISSSRRCLNMCRGLVLADHQREDRGLSQTGERVLLLRHTHVVSSAPR